MNPLNPSDTLKELSLTVWQKTDCYLWIPPGCWSLAAGVLFLSGLLLLSMSVRWWLEIRAD